MDKQQELHDFETILRRTDWQFDFAEGKAYYEGRDTFITARDRYKIIKEKYPKEAQELWARYSKGGAFC